MKHTAIIVLFGGRIGSGKDTAASVLKEVFGFKQTAFADNLKEVCSKLLNIDLNHFYDRELKETPLPYWDNKTPRQILQKVGTDLLRDQFDTDVWVKALASKVKDNYGNYVISDWRFPNEFSKLQELFPSCKFITVEIRRPDILTGREEEQHKSENSKLDAQYVMYNDGSIQEFKEKVEVSFKRLFDKYKQAE
jgi:hypothetical protein